MEEKIWYLTKNAVMLSPIKLGLLACLQVSLIIGSLLNIELFELKIRNSLINNGKEAATVYSIGISRLEVVTG